MIVLNSNWSSVKHSDAAAKSFSSEQIEIEEN